MGREVEAEVVIVGGGPVGLGLAIELGQRGVSCALVERAASMHRVPKGQNLTQRTMEHFHFWGAEAALRAARTIPRDYGIGGLTAYGSLLGGRAYDWLQRDLVAAYYHTANERLPQYATETVLRERAAQLPPIRTLFGYAADEIGQDRSGVTVGARAVETGERITLRGAYLAGCDGSRSVVREAAGVTQTLSDHDRRMALVVFTSPAFHELLARFPGKSYFNVLHPDLDGYWQFFGRVDLGSQFFFHAPVPPEATAEDFDFAGYIRRAVGADFDLAIDYVGFWDLRFAIADSYRAGRIFIAGDAAHSHPPYGGYGINLGLEDAANLGWKLAAVSKGWGAPALLDSYDEERRPVFASTARDFIERAIETDRAFLRRFDPARDAVAFEREWARRQDGAEAEVDQFEPNYEGASIVWSDGDGPSAKGRHAFEARAGHHLAPATLSDGRALFDALGADFTLLAFGARPDAVSDFEAAAAMLGVPLAVVRDADPGLRSRYAASLTLVRPDQFVGWAGEAADPGAGDILARLVGRAQS